MGVIPSPRSAQGSHSLIGKVLRKMIRTRQEMSRRRKDVARACVGHAVIQQATVLLGGVIAAHHGARRRSYKTTAGGIGIKISNDGPCTASRIYPDNLWIIVAAGDGCDARGGGMIRI